MAARKAKTELEMQLEEANSKIRELENKLSEIQAKNKVNIG